MANITALLCPSLGISYVIHGYICVLRQSAKSYPMILAYQFLWLWRRYARFSLCKGDSLWQLYWNRDYTLNSCQIRFAKSKQLKAMNLLILSDLVMVILLSWFLLVFYSITLFPTLNIFLPFMMFGIISSNSIQ